MLGDPDENEDILSFGNTDRSPDRMIPRSDWMRLRSERLRLWLDRLTLWLDRLTLRLTRRPRLAATTAGLAAVVLAGVVVYLAAPAHTAASSALAAASPAAPAPSVFIVPRACSEPGLPVQVDGKLIKFLEQAAHQSLSTPLAYSSHITIQVGTTTYGVIMVNPTTGQVSCYQQANR